MTGKVDSTLSKGLSIIEALAAEPKGIGVSELARNLELTKSNTFRLLQTLIAVGYVTQDANKQYFASMKAWKIGQMIMEKLDLPGLSISQMQYLSSMTGEAVYLAVLDGLSTLYIEKIESTKAVRTYTPKGGNAPIHCVATGKALLAFQYDALREKLIDNLTLYTDKTITSIEALDKEVAIIKAQGVAIDRGEYRAEVISIAAPVFSANNEVIAAIGVSAPAINVSEDDIDNMSHKVILAAQSLSNTLKDI
ncbi:IclR family transcriptional regulator [Marinomonas sp. A79]|uniref:HTH-type transcriptional repressor AllR n=1 Tax=Marinomonas vulgaris TaxID=2823372 RepID=A0ABS5HAU7_9GAMM|nr:IclR family transcriptional regulator [Marinomonas vulgaris]MBR7888770.1 IclR family transcriptional regulator [Marinomonas vulgaris]